MEEKVMRKQIFWTRGRSPGRKVSLIQAYLRTQNDNCGGTVADFFVLSTR